jgi:hypothetical protein
LDSWLLQSEGKHDKHLVSNLLGLLVHVHVPLSGFAGFCTLVCNLTFNIMTDMSHDLTWTQLASTQENHLSIIHTPIDYFVPVFSS